MNLQIDSVGDVKIARIQERRLVYPMMIRSDAQFSGLIDAGTRKLIIDFSEVNYIDSPCIGCLADICRMMSERSGLIKLTGVHERVETMISLVGLSKLMEMFPDEKSALESFRPLVR